jgi:phenylpyruvate tautomerase
MVVLKCYVPMAFGGTQEPTAYGELVSIGDLNPDVNKKLSAGITSILESKLSVPKSRFYLKFYDSKASRNYVSSVCLLVYHTCSCFKFCCLLGLSSTRNMLNVFMLYIKNR